MMKPRRIRPSLHMRQLCLVLDTPFWSARGSVAGGAQLKALWEGGLGKPGSAAHATGSLGVTRRRGSADGSHSQA